MMQYSFSIKMLCYFIQYQYLTVHFELRILNIILNKERLQVLLFLFSNYCNRKIYYFRGVIICVH